LRFLAILKFAGLFTTIQKLFGIANQNPVEAYVYVSIIAHTRSFVKGEARPCASLDSPLTIDAEDQFLPALLNWRGMKDGNKG
jgi:hypothetical protein